MSLRATIAASLVLSQQIRVNLGSSICFVKTNCSHKKSITAGAFPGVIMTSFIYFLFFSLYSVRNISQYALSQMHKQPNSIQLFPSTLAFVRELLTTILHAPPNLAKSISII